MTEPKAPKGYARKEGRENEAVSRKCSARWRLREMPPHRHFLFCDTSSGSESGECCPCDGTAPLTVPHILSCRLSSAAKWTRDRRELTRRASLGRGGLPSPLQFRLRSSVVLLPVGSERDCKYSTGPLLSSVLTFKFRGYVIPSASLRCSLSYLDSAWHCYPNSFR